MGKITKTLVAFAFITGQLFYSCSSNSEESEIKNENGTYENGLVTIIESGSMLRLIGSNYLVIPALKIVGPINGTDIYYLREMMTDGKLINLDLADAMIVKGGIEYHKNCSTQDNVIGRSMFEYTNLKSVTLPKKTVSIHENAFSQCNDLKEVIIPENSKIDSINEGAFYGCAKIKLFDMPKNLTYIGDMAFKDCSNLKQISFPEGLEYIGSWAFEGCYELQDGVSIPSSINYIGDHAITHTDSIVIHATTPPEIVEIPFNSMVRIYVPFNSVAKYKNHEQWGKYKIYYIGEEVDTDDESHPVPPTIEVPIVVDTMEVNPTNIEVAYIGGKITFTTTTNQNYIVASTADWITIDNDGRALTATYAVTATVATNEGEAREGRISVTFADESTTVKEVIVKQAAYIEPQPEYVVDEHGYATFTHQGFNFKIKESDYNSSRKGKDAVKYIKEDLDHIVSIIPEEALEVMRKRPIWLEKNNTANSSAAWYHTWAGYPESIGDLKEKGKCVEITNFSNYISWSDQNQPLMVLHELCHLYHDQGLGGDRNQTINEAYKNAKDNGLYAEGWYRYNINQTSQSQWTKTTDVYCMVTVWEYFAELCEAYWGENDYYPFNYEQLKEHDPVGFAMMESIWGAK